MSINFESWDQPFWNEILVPNEKMIQQSLNEIQQKLQSPTQQPCKPQIQFSTNLFKFPMRSIPTIKSEYNCFKYATNSKQEQLFQSIFSKMNTNKELLDSFLNQMKMSLKEAETKITLNHLVIEQDWTKTNCEWEYLETLWNLLKNQDYHLQEEIEVI